MIKLNSELARLFQARNYKIINTSLKLNPNALLFDTRELNEEIQCKERYFLNAKVH